MGWRDDLHLTWSQSLLRMLDQPSPYQDFRNQSEQLAMWTVQDAKLEIQNKIVYHFY